MVILTEIGRPSSSASLVKEKIDWYYNRIIIKRKNGVICTYNILEFFSKKILSWIKIQSQCVTTYRALSFHLYLYLSAKI